MAGDIAHACPLKGLRLSCHPNNRASCRKVPHSIRPQKLHHHRTEMKEPLDLSSIEADCACTPEQQAEYEKDIQAMEQMQAECPNKDKHEAIRLSGSDDGCLTCGYYSK